VSAVKMDTEFIILPDVLIKIGVRKLIVMKYYCCWWSSQWVKSCI